jgi:hypothetical protein
MKKYFTFFSVILAISLLLASCKAKVSFYINNSTSTTIPAQTPINLPFNILTPPISSSNTQEYQNNNTVPDLIQEVSLQQLLLTITSPSNQNFSFLKSIAIYIENGDGSNKKKLAYNDNVNSNSKTLELTSTGENLVPYLQDSTYKLETEYTIKAIPMQDIDINIDLKFYVTAGVL